MTSSTDDGTMQPSAKSTLKEHGSHVRSRLPAKPHLQQQWDDGDVRVGAGGEVHQAPDAEESQQVVSSVWQQPGIGCRNIVVKHSASRV